MLPKKFFYRVLYWGCGGFLSLVQANLAPQKNESALRFPLLDEMDRLKKKGFLTVAITKEPVSFFHEKNEKGQWFGINISMGQMLAQALGIPLRLDTQSQNFEEVVEKISQGKADFAFGISFSPERSKKVIYASQHYMKISQVAILNRTHLAQAGNVSLRQLLEGTPHCPGRKIIGTYKGSVYENRARQIFPHNPLLGYESWEKVIHAVAQGKATAALGNNVQVFSSLKKDFNLYIKVLPISLPKEDLLYVISSPLLPHMAQWCTLLFKNRVKEFQGL